MDNPLSPHLRSLQRRPQAPQLKSKFLATTLISSSDNKFLWERSGDTPNGFLYEKCLLDLSEEGVFKHKIIGHTLNGVTQPEEPVIILKRVE